MKNYEELRKAFVEGATWWSQYTGVSVWTKERIEEEAKKKYPNDIGIEVGDKVEILDGEFKGQIGDVVDYDMNEFSDPDMEYQVSINGVRMWIPYRRRNTGVEVQLKKVE